MHVSFYGGDEMNPSQQKEFIKPLAELHRDIRFMRSMLDEYMSIEGCAWDKNICIDELYETLKSATKHLLDLERTVLSGNNR